MARLGTLISSSLHSCDAWWLYLVHVTQRSFRAEKRRWIVWNGWSPDLQNFPVDDIFIYLNYFILNTHPLAYLNYFEVIRMCTIRDTYYVIGMVLVCFGTGLDVLSVDFRRRKPVMCQSHEFLTNLADWSSRDMCLWPSFRINLQKGWFQPIEWGSELLQYGDVKPCWIKWLWIAHYHPAQSSFWDCIWGCFLLASRVQTSSQSLLEALGIHAG